MNLAAFDPGSFMGWAVYNNQTGYHYGKLNFPSDKPKKTSKDILHNGTRFLNCMQSVRKIIQAHNITDICVEHNIMPNRSDDNAMLAGGFLSAIQMAVEIEKKAQDWEIHKPVKLVTSQWRKIFFGTYPKAPDHYDDDQKRAYHKMKAIAACVDEGFDVGNDDNIAEAILMLIAFRKNMDPEFAFSRGGSEKHQIAMAV